uniref:p0044F08.26 protein n=1 Tax=Oryza sativa subsp. japonica TaxID=39947 RepID=Q7F759_ORYSJ|nr:P0044F08.26 [Oryza sativa Japonica Group]
MKAAQSGPRRARAEEGERVRWTGLTTPGPGWDPLVSGSAHRAEGARGAALGCGGPTRSLTARGGTRARGGTDRGRPVPTSAELAPTWRLRGCHVGWREGDDDPAANGQRTATASGGANHGDMGKSEHTGRLFVMRGDEPTARIRRRELDGGESRRQQPAGREEGNGDEATRGRFPAVRASTRFRELDASVGLDGATPSEAGDVRVLRSSSGDGGEHTASDGNGRELALGGRGQSGDREDDAGEEEKGEKEGEKGGLPLCRFRKKEEVNGGDAAEEGGMLPPSLGGLRAEWRGRAMTTAMTAGRFGAERRHWRQARAEADGGGDRAVGHHGTRARLATGGAADGVARLGHARWLVGPSGCVTAGGRAAGPGGADATRHGRQPRGRARERARGAAARERRGKTRLGAGGSCARARAERRGAGRGSRASARRAREGHSARRRALARAARGGAEGEKERGKGRGRGEDGPGGNRPIDPRGGKIDFCGGI